MRTTNVFYTFIICGILLASGCTSAPTQNAPPPTATEPNAGPTNQPTIEPIDLPTTEPTIQPTDLPTTEPTIQPTDLPTTEPTIETFPFVWEGTWNVWVAAPRVSIVNVAEFVISPDNEVRSTWYEGTRQVNLEGKLSENGSTITGIFWNTDIESLDVILVLDPSGSFFTGIADDANNIGQFCGTRTSLVRPSPCRANLP